jgi:hypothetical protein
LILELLAIVALLAAPDAAPAGAKAAAAEADTKPPDTKPEAVGVPSPEKDESIERYRTPLDALTERMIGAASRAARYDWRNQTFSFGVTGGTLLELNNFQSDRIGGFVRTAISSLMVELMVTGALTQGTGSTYLLSLTPYRQAARPDHVEVDLNLGLPLLEGVTTPRWGWVPVMELVVFLELDLRYRYFPGAIANMSTGDSFKAVFWPQMSDTELNNLEPRRLPGMRIDRAKYDALAGLVFEAQFQNGIFFAPRVMICPPVMNGFTGSSLAWWWDISASLGWGF